MSGCVLLQPAFHGTQTTSGEECEPRSPALCSGCTQLSGPALCGLLSSALFEMEGFAAGGRQRQ